MTARPGPAGTLRYLDAPERRRRIVQRLRDSAFVPVADLAATLSVSDMTIRRDLRLLEQSGDVRVVHGGASLRHGTLQTPSFLARADTQSTAKRRIAAAASAMVGPRDTLALDSGSTCFEMAAALVDVGFAGTLVTDSVPVVQRMLHHAQIRVVCLGGELVHERQALIGPAGIEQVARLRVDTFFLGAVAVDERGVYVNEEMEVATKVALMDAAAAVVLLLDSSKLAGSAAVVLCPLDRLTGVVTDTRPARRVGRWFRTAGVQVSVAP